MNDAVPSISVAELRQWHQEGRPITILDVREPWELEICRFPDALAVPLHQLPQRLAEIPRDGTVVVVCHHGVRSLSAASWLAANGVPGAINLDGGIDAWARRIDPTMGVY